jgi:hypothetical protein
MRAKSFYNLGIQREGMGLSEMAVAAFNSACLAAERAVGKDHNITLAMYGTLKAAQLTSQGGVKALKSNQRHDAVTNFLTESIKEQRLAATSPIRSRASNRRTVTTPRILVTTPRSRLVSGARPKLERPFSGQRLWRDPEPVYSSLVQSKNLSLGPTETPVKVKQLSPLDADAQRYKNAYEDAGTVAKAYSCGKKEAEDSLHKTNMHQQALLTTLQKKVQRLELNEVEMHTTMNSFKGEQDMLRGSTKSADKKAEESIATNKILASKYQIALGRIGDLEEQIEIFKHRDKKRLEYMKRNNLEEAFLDLKF